MAENLSMPDIFENVDANSPSNTSETLIYELITKEQFGTINGILSIVTVVIAMTGVINNTINIFTFIRMGLNDVGNVSFLTLAISDFVYTFLTVISKTAVFFVSMEIKYDIWFTLDPYAVFIFVNSTSNLSYLMTTLMTVYLAVVRCVCVALPFSVRHIFTRRRTVLVFISFVIFFVALLVLILAEMGVQAKFDPDRNTTRLVIWMSRHRQKVKDIIVMIQYFGVSVIAEVLTVVCVLVMTSKLKSAVRVRKTMDGAAEGKAKGSKKLPEKERAVVIQVVVIASVFIVCNAVKMCHAIMMLVHPKYEIGQAYEYVYFTVSSVRSVLDSLNASVNFLIFFIFNSRFRTVCFTCQAVRKNN